MYLRYVVCLTSECIATHLCKTCRFCKDGTVSRTRCAAKDEILTHVMCLSHSTSIQVKLKLSGVSARRDRITPELPIYAHAWKPNSVKIAGIRRRFQSCRPVVLFVVGTSDTLVLQPRFRLTIRFRLRSYGFGHTWVLGSILRNDLREKTGIFMEPKMV